MNAIIYLAIPCDSVFTEPYTSEYIMFNKFDVFVDIFTKGTFEIFLRIQISQFNFSRDAIDSIPSMLLFFLLSSSLSHNSIKCLFVKFFDILFA